MNDSMIPATMATVRGDDGFVLQHKPFVGVNHKELASRWALNKATDWVAYENEWGADLFIELTTDQYGQDCIFIWDCNSEVPYPIRQVLLWETAIR